MERVRARVERGQREAALQEMLAVRDAYPERSEGDARFQFLLATLLESLDRRAEAETAYREAIRIDPDLAPAYSRLGQMLFTGVMTAQALEWMERAARRFPDRPLTQLQYAELLLRSGDTARGELLLQEIKSRWPEQPQCDYLLGLALLVRGENAAARTALERYVEARPDDPRAWYQLAHARDRLGDVDGRHEALRRFEPLYRELLGPGEGR